MKKISFAIICLLFLCIISCDLKSTPDNIVVAEAMSFLRSELPINLEGLGKIREIDYEENCVIFRMRIQEDASYGLNVTKISGKQVLAKEIVAAQIGMMNVQKIEALKDIAKESYGIKFSISASSSSQDGVIFLSSEDIKKAIENAQEKPADDFSLEMVSMTTRIMLPVKVDQVTTWTDTRLTNDSFEYVYRIDDTNIDLIKLDKEILKQEKLTMLSQNMDIMGNVIRCCLSTSRNLVYEYIGTNSGTSIQVILTPSELEAI